MKEYGVGIIGAGFMGKTHTYDYINIPLFYENPGFKIRLVGICNRTLSKAEKLKDMFNFDFATSNYEDLLERKDIDIIDVCTPNDVHHAQITAAVEAEKNLYVDKPLCISDDEADDIVSRVNASKIIHQMAFNMRFYPAVKKMKMLIDDGFIGELISFRVTYYHASNLNPKVSRGWRQDLKRAGGGVLYDMGSHALDIVYHLLGRFKRLTMSSRIIFPERMDETGRMVKVETEDHVMVSCEMEDGALGTVEVSKVILGSNDDLNIQIFGTKAAIKFNTMNPNFLFIYDSTDPDRPIGGNRGYKAVETINKDPDSSTNFPGPRFPIGWLRAHVACHYNFLKNLNQGSQPRPSIQDGAYIQKVMNALYRVNNTGEWVESPV